MEKNKLNYFKLLRFQWYDAVAYKADRMQKPQHKTTQQKSQHRKKSRNMTTNATMEITQKWKLCWNRNYVKAEGMLKQILNIKILPGKSNFYCTQANWILETYWIFWKKNFFCFIFYFYYMCADPAHLHTSRWQ